MAKKIFYHRRSRRRFLTAAGLALSAFFLFSAGVYTGIAWAPVFTGSHPSGAIEPQAALAAAEF